MSIDTSFEGRPGSLEGIADWLRTSFGPGADTLATEVINRRKKMNDSWVGEGGDAFGSRARELAKSSETADETATTSASTIDVLASAMRSAKEGLVSTRETARGAGLTVTGATIHEPGPVDHPGMVPGTEADNATVEAYNGRVNAWNAYQDKVTAYNKASGDVDEYLEGWRKALDSAAERLAKDDANLVGLAGNLIVDGGGGAVAARMAVWYADAAKVSRETAVQAATHLDEMITDGRLVGTKGQYYDYLQQKAQALKNLDDFETKAGSPKLPRGAKIGGGIIGLLTLGYGIKSDLDDGESTEQAVVSNVGGTAVGMGAAIAASAGAGAAVGALGGSVVPGLGTAVGAVAGVVVGAGVGMITSGAIDSMYENGVKNIGDVGEAIGDGWGDLTTTTSTLWNAGGDLIDGIF